MQKFQADIIYPQHILPISNGILLAEDDGTIIDVVNPTLIDYTIEDVKVLQGALCPGFVNTHSHLELSYMYRKIPQQYSMADFIGHVEHLKKTVSHEDKIIAIEETLNQLKFNGTVALGDIVNTADTLYAKQNSKLYFHNFIEVYGSNATVAEQRFNDAVKLVEMFSSLNAATMVPHAPYSVSPTLFRLINQYTQTHPGPISIHHAESMNEIEFFKLGTGSIKEMLSSIGTDVNQFAPFNKTSFDYLTEYFLPVNSPLQLVHNTYIDWNIFNSNSQLLNNSTLCFCLCPNSNLFIENKLPDINLLVANNLAITIGTDSLASNTKLSMLYEMEAIHIFFPEIPLQTILKWATLNGAKFLGIDHKYGSFEKGKTPGIVNFNKHTFEIISVL